jgi:tetratricopeptide (TPR) repeat protein
LQEIHFGFENTIVQTVENDSEKYFSTAEMNFLAVVLRNLTILQLIVSAITSVQSPPAFEADNFLSREIAAFYFQQGLELSDKDVGESASALQKSFSLFPNVYTLDFIFQQMDLVGKKGQVFDWMREHSEVLDELNRLHNKIVEARQETSALNYDRAISMYNELLSRYPDFPELVFLKGLNSEKLGRLEEAAELLLHATRLNPIHVRALLALGTIHQKYGDYEDCFEYYEKGSRIYELYLETIPGVLIIHDDYMKIRSNLFLAYFQKGALKEAFQLAKEYQKYLQSNYEKIILFKESQQSPDYDLNNLLLSDDGKEIMLSNHSNQPSKELASISMGLSFLEISLHGILSNFLVIQRSSLHFQDWELSYTKILHQTLNYINLVKREYGPLLPFDSLLIPITMTERLIVANSLANNYYQTLSFNKDTTMRKPLVNASEYILFYESLLFLPSTVDQRPRIEMPLRRENSVYCSPVRIGFISYDFNDHPTSHLIEGFFQLIHSFRKQEELDRQSHNESSSSGCPFYSKMEISIFFYGKKDDSSYYHLFRNLTDHYYDISLFSYEEISRLFRFLQIQVLYEMQIHTLGNRMQIVSDLYHQQRYLSMNTEDGSLSYNSNGIIIINYLVYPGSSGSYFYDYIYCDQYVIPIERSAVEYSEKLMIIPNTYQISYYSEDLSKNTTRLFFENFLFSVFHSLKSSPVKDDDDLQTIGLQTMKFYQFHLRKVNNLPLQPDAIVFCNFNKIDKIDPVSFQIWINVS